jgi:hypothetical protein
VARCTSEPDWNLCAEFDFECTGSVYALPNLPAAGHLPHTRNVWYGAWAVVALARKSIANDVRVFACTEPAPFEPPPSSAPQRVIDLLHTGAHGYMQCSKIDCLTNCCCLNNFTVSIDPLYPLSPDDRELIWSNRLYIIDYLPRGLPKFVVSTPLPSRQATIEMQRLLSQWEPMSPLDALEVRASMAFAAYAQLSTANIGTDMRWILVVGFSIC